MNAVKMMQGTVSLNKALLLCNVSKKAWYYTPKTRDIPPDPKVQEMVQKIAPARPTYGSRRMAAQISRELGRQVNRKAIQCIFKRLGWTQPSRTKLDIIRTNKKLPRPKAPNKFWESDMSYIWCGTDGWGYCFNVLDVFTRQWLAFVLASRATRREAIRAVTDAVAAADPTLPGLTLRVDNGSQYTSREFRSSMAALEISLEYIYVNTPEQNGHIESFHKTLKKEYVWPHEFADIQEAREALLAAFEDYNHRRIHSAIQYLTPSEFAKKHGQGSEGATPDIPEVSSVNKMLRKSVSMGRGHSSMRP